MGTASTPVGGDQSVDGGRPSATGVDTLHAGSIIRALSLLLIYEAYSISIIGVSSPWIARSFHLDQAGIARLFALVSVSALGSLALSRLADLAGRRRIMLFALGVSPVCALGSVVATNALIFGLFQVVLFAMAGGAVSCATVTVAEELPAERRARGQAYVGFASAIGGSLGYVVIPLLVKYQLDWRWMLAPSVAGFVLLPAFSWMMPVSKRWEQAASAGRVTQSHIYGVFAPRYRKRAITLLVCAALDTMAGTAVNSWLYFQAVSVIGLSPATASLIVMIGSGAAMLGFPMGAYTAERFGRVPTVVYLGIVAWLGALGFYWGPPRSLLFPMVWLTASYSCFRIFAAAMTVGANAATTELFATELRGTMIGWQFFNVAIFSILAQSLIAVLTRPLGGLANVIGCFALLGIPSALTFGAFIDETRGLALEAAAQEFEEPGRGNGDGGSRPLAEAPQ